MSGAISRRKMLQETAVGTGVAIMSAKRAAAAVPKAKVHELKVISHESNLYHGWPTVARRRDGQLLVVWSGGREEHVCPFGRVEFMRSNDGGLTWTWPRVLMDSAIDDRDSGVLETARGTILVTTFTSLAWEPHLKKAESLKPGQKGAWSPERLERWRAARDRIPAGRHKDQLGVWMLRSTDGGMTWSAPYRCLVNSPHGPVQLSDGRVLYAGKPLWTDPPRIGVCESTDDGKSWRWLAEIPARPGDHPKDYHELHAVETADGRIVCQVRNHNQANSHETLQCESKDGGKTWTPPEPIGVWGLPSHLLRLKDDRLLMTYGHRRKPLGNQARISADHGRTWSEPIILDGEAVSGDLGYPSTVQLDDGSLVSVWYERMKGSSKAVLRQARWTLEG